MKLAAFSAVQRKWLSLAAYNALFWSAFWLFCYWTFPYERVASHLIDRVAQAGKGYTLEIGELSPYWLSGVELTDVVLRKDPGEAPPVKLTGDKTKAADGSFRIKDARARMGILSLLFGAKSVSFDVTLEGGEIDGSYEGDAELKTIKATLEQVDLQKLGLIESALQIPMIGALNGQVDLTLGKNPQQSQGSVKLKVDKLTVGDGKAKVKLGSMGGLTLDPINAGDLTLEMDFKNGVGTIDKLSTNGKDLLLKGSGEVRLAEPLSSSRVSVLLNVRFTDAYRNKSPRTQAMFSLLDSAGASELKAARMADGALQYRLTGSFNALRPIPEGTPPGSTRSPGAASNAVRLSPSSDDEAE